MLLSWIATGLRRLLLGMLILFIASTCLAVLTLRWFDPPTSMFIQLSSQERAITGPKWADWENISPWIALTVLAAEDQRFPSHRGFDATEIGRAIAERVQGTRIRGASTITQQLAKNLFLWPDRSWLRKGLEAYFTILLELFLSKRRILELYLNLAEFGPWLFSVETAAAKYYSKTAAGLTLREASLLAAALPSPRTANPAQPSEFLSRRAQRIREQVEKLGGRSYLQTILDRR